LREAYYDKPFIKINNLSFSYNNQDNILNNINASFKKGEFTAVVGPNGSGKTTFGKLLCGILKPNKGNIYIEENEVNNISLGMLGKKIGYLFQEPERQLFNPTVFKEIGFAHSFMGNPEDEVKSEVEKLIDDFSLEGLKDSSPYKISRGERQRVALASIFINNPSFLILDEPTTGLDMVRKEQLIKLLKNLLKKGIGMIVISHDNKFIDSIADRILKISGGDIHEL
jgi:energy-coupling factor transport system ATP-binding protein